jgi:hypothetical protein
MNDPHTWNDLARQCADLQSENAELRKKVDTQTQTDCPYCHEPTSIMPIHACSENDGECYIQTCTDGTALFLMVDRYYTIGHIDIEYCPMCGRRLDDD